MTEKYSDYLTGIELILYIGFGFERYPNYLTGFGLTFILLNTGLELLNQPSRDVITKV